MNYLFRYLGSLSDDELALLDRIELSPRERQTLDTLLHMRGGDEPTKEEAIARLAMSGTMFDKTCSILLRSAYDAIVPEGGLALLADLEHRRLRPLTLHELGRQERENSKE